MVKYCENCKKKLSFTRGLTSSICEDCEEKNQEEGKKDLLKFIEDNLEIINYFIPYLPFRKVKYNKPFDSTKRIEKNEKELINLLTNIIHAITAKPIQKGLIASYVTPIALCILKRKEIDAIGVLNQESFNCLFDFFNEGEFCEKGINTPGLFYTFKMNIENKDYYIGFYIGPRKIGSPRDYQGNVIGPQYPQVFDFEFEQKSIETAPSDTMWVMSKVKYLNIKQEQFSAKFPSIYNNWINSSLLIVEED